MFTIVTASNNVWDSVLISPACNLNFVVIVKRAYAEVQLILISVLFLSNLSLGTLMITVGVTL